jgi:hypothetical protein
MGFNMSGMQDRLLKTTTAAIKLAVVLVYAFIAVALIVLPVLLVAPDRARVLGAYQHLERARVIASVEIWLAGGLMISVLLLLALGRIRRIVASAISSDPFVQENALLLRQVGWLALAIHGIQITCDGVVSLFVLDGHAGFSPAQIPGSGLIAVLLIFVLARIFQRGSEMRADLEGTV